MNNNDKKVQEILKQRGIDYVTDISVSKEDIPEAAFGCQKLLDTYYVLKNTLDMEVTYWYNRTWQENDGEITEIRRAKSLAAAYSHITPKIQPF